MTSRSKAMQTGDFNGDGQTDYMVAGQDGAALWARDDKGQREDITRETGELGAGAGNNTTVIPASFVSFACFVVV